MEGNARTAISVTKHQGLTSTGLKWIALLLMMQSPEDAPLGQPVDALIDDQKDSKGGHHAVEGVEADGTLIRSGVCGAFGLPVPGFSLEPDVYHIL